MKIAIIGYGGMGSAVARVARDKGHEVSVIVDPSHSAATAPSLEAKTLAGVDIALDFSASNNVEHAVKTCVDAGIPLVVGTTGWYERMDAVRSLVGNAPPSFALLWSSNFSIGVHMYFRIIQAAARLVDKIEEYDVWGHEIHHTGKADSPSGTAKSLEKILLDNITRKTTVVEERLDRKRKDSEIHFSSVRGGLVNFGHTIGFDSAADRILITHEARTRDGYALGAVKAAEWLLGKSGWYSIDEYLEDTFGK